MTRAERAHRMAEGVADQAREVVWAATAAADIRARSFGCADAKTALGGLERRADGLWSSRWDRFRAALARLEKMAAQEPQRRRS